jgi:hypothetical protein
MRDKEISEGLGELADRAERDHEVQMARSELYKLAKYAIKLHDILKGVSEAEGLEGWVQSKITKAADMLGSVYHHMDYEESGLADEAVVVGEAKKDTHCSDKCCGADVKAEDCGCPPTCKHCNCNATNESTNEGPFKGAGKVMMKRKLKKQYKKSDLANFDKSGIDTSGKSPEEVGDMKSDFYHGHMDKAARAKKAMNRLSKKKESYKEELHLKLEGKKKFKSAAHRKAVHAAKASGKR